MTANQETSLRERLLSCAKGCEVYSPDQCATLIDGIGWIAMRALLREAADAIDQAYRDGYNTGRMHAARAEPQAGELDPQLATFYQVDSVPALLAAMEEHIEQLQESARRNVKPWEDTFPPTLLPKYLRDNGLPETPAPTAVVHVHTASIATPPASGEAGADGFAQVCDALGIGADARTVGGVLTNIRNLRHFADCLHAIEREFFMAPGEPDDEFPDDEPEPECLVNSWGSTREQYVEQFRSAIRRLAAVAPAGMNGLDEKSFAVGYRMACYDNGEVPDDMEACAKEAYQQTLRHRRAIAKIAPTPPATAGEE